MTNTIDDEQVVETLAYMDWQCVKGGLQTILTSCRESGMKEEVLLELGNMVSRFCQKFEEVIGL